MKTSCLILLTILCTSGLIAQEMDTLYEIALIRERYGEILNKQIKNIEAAEIDNSYEPTEEEMEEAPFGSVEKFTAYHNSVDTFLIRKYNMSDEGGAFSHSVEEVLFWNNKPFFYYRKWYGSWNQVLKEIRIYIVKGTAIRKLTKESNISWNELSNDFYDTQTDIPNQVSLIDPNDLDDVEYFIKSSYRFLHGLKTE